MDLPPRKLPTSGQGPGPIALRSENAGHPCSGPPAGEKLRSNKPGPGSGKFLDQLVEQKMKMQSAETIRPDSMDRPEPQQERVYQSEEPIEEEPIAVQTETIEDNE